MLAGRRPGFSRDVKVESGANSLSLDTHNGAAMQ
jgi:hypothetical protein